MNWLILALLSAIFWGTENFLHKVAAKNGLSSSKVSVVMAVTASVLSILCVFIFHEKIINIQFLVIISILNAVTFFGSFMTRIESLRTINASIFFPISKVGSLVIIILLSLFALHEKISNPQWLGLLLSLAAIYLLTSKMKEKSVSKTASFMNKSVLFLFVSTILAALANLTADLAAHKTGTYSFSFLSYLVGIPFSYVITRLNIQKSVNNEEVKVHIGVYTIGILIGVLNFAGLVTFLLALEKGAFPIVSAINNFSMLLVIMLSVLMYKEKPIKKEIGGIVIAFLSFLLFNS